MRHRHIWTTALLAVVLTACASGASDETTTSTAAEPPETTTTTAADPAASPEIAAWCEIRQETYEYDIDDPAAIEAALTQSLAYNLARTEAAPAEIADAMELRTESFAGFVEALESVGWRLEDLPEPEPTTAEEDQALRDADDLVLAFELEHCGYDSREEGPVGN